jgi:hypothetical protein
MKSDIARPDPIIPLCKRGVGRIIINESDKKKK